MKKSGEGEGWIQDRVLNRKNLEVEQASDEEIVWIMEHK